MENRECSHEIREVILTPELKHHGKELCKTCGRFLRWIPKPETAQKNEELRGRLQALDSNLNLSQWEKEFIESVKKQFPKLSPKQKSMIDEIYRRIG